MITMGTLSHGARQRNLWLSNTGSFSNDEIVAKYNHVQSNELTQDLTKTDTNDSGALFRQRHVRRSTEHSHPQAVGLN